MDILFFFCRYKFGRATSFFLYTENKSRTMKNFCIWQFHKWFQCLCFLQFGFYWDMQLYGHKQHNYRNDANFRKLTGKVLSIIFYDFWFYEIFFAVRSRHLQPLLLEYFLSVCNKRVYLFSFITSAPEGLKM